MLGTKIRTFAPLPDLSLEELIPKDNFYRDLEETLDLSFVRDLVEECYDLGRCRPSVDPVVFFNLVEGTWQAEARWTGANGASSALWRSTQKASP
jgi:hypothetical protein